VPGVNAYLDRPVFDSARHFGFRDSQAYSPQV